MSAPVAEDELHAYVDGALDAGRRAEVEQFLSRNPAVAARIGAYARQRDGLRAAFAPYAAAPVPASLRPARLLAERARRRRAAWRVAASVMLALGLGAAGGWVAGSGVFAGAGGGLGALAREAAASYAVYGTDPLRPVELPPGSRDALVQWLSARMARGVAPPDLRLAGYAFMGGRLVPTDHGPAGLFLYDSAQGGRLMVFVRPMPSSGTTAIRQTDAAGLDGCAWIEDGMGYGVIAPEPYDRLLELARHVRAQVRRQS